MPIIKTRFFRQIEVELEKWAAKQVRKPLILRGAL
ncbi:MAG: hypothetical protein RLZZ417_2084 [Bacteroidota bacterium]|jgi:hypothetical protein